MQIRSHRSILKCLPSLTRYAVSLAVTFTTATCYLIGGGGFDLRLLWSALGVFLLSSGASALNQYQERHFDTLMERTRRRPLPLGIISPRAALLLALVVILAGSLVLFTFAGVISFLLGLFNLFWYNLVYTKLKPITSFAVVPGSLVGAVPALIGWSAAGGSLTDPRILIIAFFLFIWQIPHFWFLLLKYGKEYEAAGLASVRRVFGTRSLKSITYCWILATSATSFMFPLFHVLNFPLFLFLILVLNGWLVITFTRITFQLKLEINYKTAFATINLFMVVVLLLLTMEAVMFTK